MTESHPPSAWRPLIDDWVERESQVGIVVGKGGEQVKQIGIAARAMIEEQLDTKLHLSLRVKVRRHWRDDATWLARAGL